MKVVMLDRSMFRQLPCECTDPSCTNAIATLSPACHEGAGLQVHYVRARGALVLLCSVCNNIVACVSVDKGRRGKPRTFEFEIDDIRGHSPN